MAPFIILDDLDDGEPRFEVEVDCPPSAAFDMHQLVIEADSNSPKLAELLAFVNALAHPNLIYKISPEFMQLSPRNRNTGRLYPMGSSITVSRYKVHLEPSQRILLKLELSI